MIWQKAEIDHQPKAKNSSGYQAGNNIDGKKQCPWNHKLGGFLANSKKEKSMNQNANYVIGSVWIYFQIPRNFSSANFVIEPCNNGFSNFEQVPSNDK